MVGCYRMKEIKNFLSAIEKASHDTSRYMTSQLRSEASASGWDNDIIGTLKVHYGKDGFQAHSHSSHVERVKDFEYGTPDRRPTAAIRRFSNRPKEHGEFFAGRLKKIVGEL